MQGEFRSYRLLEMVKEDPWNRSRDSAIFVNFGTGGGGLGEWGV